jgi:hypothetical protein
MVKLSITKYYIYFIYLIMGLSFIHVFNYLKAFIAMVYFIDAKVIKLTTTVIDVDVGAICKIN